MEFMNVFVLDAYPFMKPMDPDDESDGDTEHQDV
jgi:hypothetical protein